MRRSKHTGLIALNAALVAALAMITLAPGASAQDGVARRPRGEYTMVAGRVQGVSESAIYVVDSTNQEILAMRWDRSRKTLTGLGFRSMAVDSGRPEGRGR